MRGYGPKVFWTAIRLFDRSWYLRELSRLIQAVWQSNRMRQAVPEKVRQLRRYRPWPFALRAEMAAEMAVLARDVASRSEPAEHPSPSPVVRKCTTDSSRFPA